MHKAQAGLHTAHVLWGVILLERLVTLFVRLRELWGLGPWGWHHKPALAEVFWRFLWPWGGQCAGVGGRSHPSAVLAPWVGSQDKPSQNS